MIYKAQQVLPIGAEAILDGEVLVEHGVIMDVGKGLTERYPNEPLRDLGNCALMPGFINAHSHIDYTMSRNTCDGLNLWDWLDAVGFRKGRVPDRELILASAKLGAAECAASGITCLGDSSFSGAAAEAMDAIGLRGIVYLELFGQSWGGRHVQEYANYLDRVKQAQEQSSSLVRIGISPHSVYTTTPEVLKLCAKTCADTGLPISIHLAETEAEASYLRDGTGPLAQWREKLGYLPMVTGLSPARYLKKIGLLQKNVSLAHSVHLDDEEIGLIRASGASVVHCPRSNAYLGTGIAPLPELLAAGVPVGLGTDSSGSCLRMDFFEEMRFALGLARARAKDAEVITAKYIVKMATAGGAAALGLSDQIGTLEPGKRADMVAINLDSVLPSEDIYLAIISRSPSDVAMVVVDGREIASDGQLMGDSLYDLKMNLISLMEK